MQSTNNKQLFDLINKRKEKYYLALEYLEQNKIEESKTLLEELFNPLYNSSKIIKTYNFDEKIEFFLYCNDPSKLKSFKLTLEPAVKYAYTIASIYLEQNNVLKEIEYLEKALTFNPICQYILQELIEKYISINEYDKAYNYLSISLKNSYTKAHLAFCYKYLGKYFVKKEKYDIAIASFSISQLYEDDIQNKIEIKKITDKVGYIRFSSAEELLTLFKKEDLNYGPSEYVIKTITTFIKFFKDHNNKEEVVYLVDIIKKLTNNEKMFLKEE